MSVNLKAWAHWALINPISEDQKLHAEATRDLIAEHEQLQAENAVLVEALEKIYKFTKSTQVMGEHFRSVMGIAETALANTSERAKALLAVVDLIKKANWREGIKGPWSDVFIISKEEFKEINNALYVYDNLKEGNTNDHDTR